MSFCGLSQPGPVDLPDAGEGTCCYGAAVFGPGRCTCWEPVYDLDQADPDKLAVQLLAAGVEPVTRARPCGDCAYRAGSPERRGEDGYAGNQELLDRIVAKGERFWCHQGMRKPVAYRHPSGVVVPYEVDGYDPPRVGNVPYKADGQPAKVCAGWAARHRALAAEVTGVAPSPPEAAPAHPTG